MSTPVVLLTGFLGSGKTTFINWLIKTHPDLKISLILNEFGDVPIESQFIEKEGIQMAELKNGCMCCVAQGDIPRVVKYILETSPDTQYLLVEASGLSDPAPVYASLTSAELSSLIHLDVNLCIVDALNFETIRQKFPIVMSQIGDSDIILISKTLEAGPEKVAALKQMLNANIGSIRILEINDSLSPDLFLDIGTVRTSHFAPRTSNSPHAHTHEHVTDLFFKADKVNYEKISQILRSLPNGIIRAKGVMCTETDKKLLFQLVGNRLQLNESQWGSDEPHQTNLLFLGTDFDKTTLESQLQSCSL
jgi:G3E family GTPase